MNRQRERRKEKSDSDSDGGGDAHKCVKRARKSYNGSRKYLDSWEKEFPWLISVASGNSRLPFCKLCQKCLKPHRSTQTRHAQVAQLKEILKAASTSQVLNFRKKKSRCAGQIEAR